MRKASARSHHSTTIQAAPDPTTKTKCTDMKVRKVAMKSGKVSGAGESLGIRSENIEATATWKSPWRPELEITCVPDATAGMKQSHIARSTA